MSKFLIFVLIIGGTVGSNLVYKLAGDQGEKAHFSPNHFCTLYQSICACTYGGLMLATGQRISALTMSCGMVAGVGLALAAWCYVRALKSGPYTVSVVMFNYSSFLVIVYSAIFLQEKVSGPRMLGLCILMILIYFIIARSGKGEEQSQAEEDSQLQEKEVSRWERKAAARSWSGRWVTLILAVLILNSIVRFMLRYQGACTRNEDNAMMVVYFGTAAVINLIFTAMDKTGPKISAKAIKGALPLSLVMAVCIGLSTWGQVILPFMNVEASIQYPIQCSGSIIVSALVGRLFFAERLEKRVYLLILLSILVVFGIYAL